MFGRDKMNAQMLTDITRGIHHAVNTTGTMISQQYVMLLQQFFDSEEDGSISAKMVKLKVDDQHDMLVPLIALVQPQGIALDKMRFDLSIKITESELKKATHDVDGINAERCAFKVNLSPSSSDSSRRRTDIVDVEMQFTRCEAPEGIHRLIEQYSAMIQPFKPRKTEPDVARDPKAGPFTSGEASDPSKKKNEPNIVKMNTLATGDLPKDDDT